MYKGRNPRFKWPKGIFTSSKDKDLPTKQTYERLFYYTTQYPLTGPVVVNGMTRDSASFGSNSRTRVLDPNWKVKVRKKQDATNPYVKIEFDGRPTRISGSCYYSNGQGRSSGTRVEAFYPSFANWDDASTKDLALKRIKKKISDNVGFYNAVVPVVELRELRSGITSMFESAADVYNKLHARLVQRRIVGKSYKAAIADVWLQWSFGIKPLLSDIRKANDAISQFLTKSDHIVRLQGGSSITRTKSDEFPNYQGLQGFSITYKSAGFERLFYKYVGAFDLKVKSSNDYSGSSTFGIEPSSVISTLYELTPYSWLVDYFTSLGDYLDDTFEVPSGATLYLSLTRTHIRALELSASYKAVFPSQVSLLSQKVSPGFHGYRGVFRERLPSLPHLSLRIKTADEIGKNAGNKLANLVSVFKSAHGVPYGTKGKGLVKDPVSRTRRDI